MPGDLPDRAATGRPPRRRRGLGRMRLRLARRWERMKRPFSGMLRSRRAQRTRRAVDRRRVWRRSRPVVRIVKVGSAAGGVLLLALIAGSVYSVASKRPSGFLAFADRACAGANFSCNILSGTLGPLLSLALASAIFLLVRLWLVREPYVRKARLEPQRVVRTAGSMIGEVVGRDELCHVLIEDLRDPGSRRPHVVIGGVGAGKTALLVRLTQLLAERGAVPVPVRLRDAQTSLDFRDLARRRFMADTDTALPSDAQGERVWRELCKNDQVVVLADGLDEALIEGSAKTERDNLLRLAIRQANEHRLPLIITSRPHDPLRDMEAAIVELEPLSEEAALAYVQRGGGEDHRRLDWVVETADVAETPFYLQVTRQLYQAGLMEHVTARREDRRLDTRSVDRVEMRLRLLESWLDALVDGYFPSGLPLSREDRLATVEVLSMLACIGFGRDRLEVKFDDAEALRTAPDHAMIDEVDRALGQLKRRFDLRLAAYWGTRLGLVEARGDRVHFPHSIMQAYLASRLIDVAMASETYRREALRSAGREFLIALVMRSRAKLRDSRSGEAATHSRRAGRQGRVEPDFARLLCEEARGRSDVKALNLYAAALQIDCVEKEPRHDAIAAELAEKWPEIWARDQRTLEEAKRNLVRRFGESARTIAERRLGVGEQPGHPGQGSGYFHLYRICCAEPSYLVRLEGAQEIGAGGDAAFAALEPVLGSQADPLALQEAAPSAATAGDSSKPDPSPRNGEDHEREEHKWNEKVLRAWLAPLLVGSVTGQRSGAARTNLEQWLHYISATSRSRAEANMRRTIEVALAQGFKYAANRRRRHPHAQPEARAYLAERAREVLADSEFWFSRLTLVHALSLWSLADGARQRPRERADVNHAALVKRWLASPGGRREHPFVTEASRLAVLALETRQPERFIWIDESGVAARIGSRPADPLAPRKHNLWIPPSTGWTALHPRAQQLLADVLLLLNLAERGAQARDRSRRLQRTNRSDLPPCLAGDRTPLDPIRTVGMAATSEPGSNCKHGCHFELCPYPPMGEASYRIELSEAFCRRQQALVSGAILRRQTAPWQETVPTDLRRFWKQMGQRGQPADVDSTYRVEPVDRRSRRPRRPDRT